MARWEYLEVFVYGDMWMDSRGRRGELQPLPERLGDERPRPVAPLLDALDADGWELAGGGTGGTSRFFRLLLKRPRPDRDDGSQAPPDQGATAPKQGG